MARTDAAAPGTVGTQKPGTPDTEQVKLDLMLDISQLVLDIAGIVDPTPVSDGANALISLGRGNWWDAAISAVSIIPYVGDLAKLGKLPRYVKSIEKAIQIARADIIWARKLKPVMENFKTFLDKVVEVGADALPKSAMDSFNAMKKSVDDFLVYASNKGSAGTKTEKAAQSGTGAATKTPKKPPKPKPASNAPAQTPSQIRAESSPPSKAKPEPPKNKELVPNRKELKQSGSGNYDDSADELYEAIRAKTTDVDAIAANTGIKPHNIQKVKDHVFYNEHLLDRYTDYGVPAEWGKFDSDLGQANAWSRLENGTHTKADIDWLKHETAESWYETRNNSGYLEAHEAASKHWPFRGLGGE